VVGRERTRHVGRGASWKRRLPPHHTDNRTGRPA